MGTRGNATEEDILTNHIDPVVGDDDVGDTNAAQTEAAVDAEAAPEQEVANGQTDQGNSGSGTEDKPATGQKEPANPKDITLADGTIIRGGAERRFFEENNALKRDLSKQNKEITRLTTEVNAFKQASNITTQFGLTPEETVTAGNLMAAWKKDPVETVKYLLTQVRAMGHNIDDVGGSVDIAAIKQMIEESVKPFRQDRDSQLQQHQAVERANQQYQEFIERYPDAVVHDKSLAQLLTRDPNLTPEAALLVLKNFYLENQLDWKIPLDVHQANARKPSEQQKPQPTKEMPNGRTNTAQVIDQSPFASETDDWDSIVRESLRTSGLNV